MKALRLLIILILISTFGVHKGELGLIKAHADALFCSETFFEMGRGGFEPRSDVSEKLRKLFVSGYSKKDILSKVRDYLTSHFISDKEAFYIIDKIPYGIDWGRPMKMHSSVRAFFKNNYSRKPKSIGFVSIDLEILYMTLSRVKIVEGKNFEPLLKQVLTKAKKTTSYRDWTKNKELNSPNDVFRGLFSLAIQAGAHSNLMGQIPFFVEENFIRQALDLARLVPKDHRLAVIDDLFTQNIIKVKIDISTFQLVLDALPGGDGWGRDGAYSEIKEYMDGNSENALSWDGKGRMYADIRALFRAMDALENYYVGKQTLLDDISIGPSYRKVLKVINSSQEIKGRRKDYVGDIKASFVSRLFHIFGRDRYSDFDSAKPEENYIYWLLKESTFWRKKHGNYLIKRISDYVSKKPKINAEEALFIMENLPPSRLAVRVGGDSDIMERLNEQFDRDWELNEFKSDLIRWMLFKIMSKVEKVQPEQVTKFETLLKKHMKASYRQDSVSLKFLNDFEKLLDFMISERLETSSQGGQLIAIGPSQKNKTSLALFEESLDAREMMSYLGLIENYGLRKRQSRDVILAARRSQLSIETYIEELSKYRFHIIALARAKQLGRGADFSLENYASKFDREQSMVLSLKVKAERLGTSSIDVKSLADSMEIDSSILNLLDIYGQMTYGIGNINSIVFMVYESIRGLVAVYRDERSTPVNLGEHSIQREKVIEEFNQFEFFLQQNRQVLGQILEVSKGHREFIQNLLNYRLAQVSQAEGDEYTKSLAERALRTTQELAENFDVLAAVIESEFQRIDRAIEALIEIRLFLVRSDSSNLTGEELVLPSFNSMDDYMRPPSQKDPEQIPAHQIEP